MYKKLMVVVFVVLMFLTKIFFSEILSGIIAILLGLYFFIHIYVLETGNKGYELPSVLLGIGFIFYGTEMMIA